MLITIATKNILSKTLIKLLRNLGLSKKPKFLKLTIQGKKKAKITNKNH